MKIKYRRLIIGDKFTDEFVKHVFCEQDNKWVTTSISKEEYYASKNGKVDLAHQRLSQNQKSPNISVEAS